MLQGSQPLLPEQQPEILPHIIATASQRLPVPTSGPPAAAKMSTSAINVTTTQPAQKKANASGPLVGSPPDRFTGDRERTNDFLKEFKVWRQLNLNHELMITPYQ